MMKVTVIKRTASTQE